MPTRRPRVTVEIITPEHERLDRQAADNGRWQREQDATRPIPAYLVQRRRDLAARFDAAERLPLSRGATLAARLSAELDAFDRANPRVRSAGTTGGAVIA